jgi:hypothetical protein
MKAIALSKIGDPEMLRAEDVLTRSHDIVVSNSGRSAFS